MIDLKTIVETCFIKLPLCVAFSRLTILSFDVMFFLQKKDLKSSEPPPQPQGLSLPIDEKIWVQVCEFNFVSVHLCVSVT